MQQPLEQRIYGIDFSGASDAGRRIWLAGGSPGDHGLHVDFLTRARDLPGGGLDRLQAIRALRNFINTQRSAVFGLDFPFGLPRRLVDNRLWSEFVTAFPRRYPDEETFRASCHQLAEGREWRRACDVEARTPFSPYNIRLYRQTFYGIRDLLAPLVESGTVAVLPMETAWAGVPWIIEICPASTLKEMGLYRAYKGKDPERREQRQAILDGLKAHGLDVTETVEEEAIRDRHGDALDSLIAAFSTWRAVRDADFAARSPDEALEGRVYL